MMRAVETLRQRLPPSLGYAPVLLSDSDDDDGDGGRGEFEIAGGNFGGGRHQDRDLRRPRRRVGGGGEAGGGATMTGGGGRQEEEDDLLWPPYTPLYTNMKVLRRKRLDASMMYSRAGPCTKICFLTSLWGASFLTWLGFTLASGSPYIIPEDPPATNLARSRSVFGAAAMYLVCACLTGYSWYKSSWGARPLPTLGDSTLP
ncbi:unnamed protein product [Ectocarpus sp. CCAP 1310/34]|nr:unnamed protein product [Ectocarpus sp. CCAP 1310/34]